MKYKAEAKKYLKKNVDALRDAKTGQAYNVLNKLGAQPGDCIDSNTFVLPNHESEGLSEEQSAERIAEYFSEISQEFPPLNVNCLPDCVQTKLQHASDPPIISDYETYRKIRVAKKPKSGVPMDLPKLIVQEFSPELAKPVIRIINNIMKSGVWPNPMEIGACYSYRKGSTTRK